MSITLEGIKDLLPSIFLFAVSTLGFLFSSLLKNYKLSYFSSAFSLLFSSIYSFFYLYPNMSKESLGVFIFDTLTYFCWICIPFFAFLSIVFSKNFFDDEKETSSEFFYLLTLSTFGAILWSSSSEFLTLFLTMEISSYTSYVLCLSSRNRQGNEAAFKYFVLGAITSIIFAIGLSIWYMGQGETKITKPETGLSYAGLVIMISTILFKAGISPLHFWVPDIYQGAPSPFVSFLSSCIKISAFISLRRMVAPIFPDLSQIFVILAFLSMLFGTLGALTQKEVKRMLGYSAIAHSGFLLLIFFSEKNLTNFFTFYLFSYSLSTLGFFGALSLVKHKESFVSFDCLTGLSEKKPFLALSILIFSFSLLGIPFFSGFFAKYFAFFSAFSDAPAWLIISAAVFSAISLYFYLAPLVSIYMEKGECETINPSFGVKFSLFLAMLITIVLGLSPDIFFKLFGG